MRCGHVELEGGQLHYRECGSGGPPPLLLLHPPLRSSLYFVRLMEALQASGGPRVIALDRKKVRQRFEQRFSATRMAKDYVSVYRSLTESSKSVDVAKQAPRRRLGNGEDLGNGQDLGNSNDAIILRPSIA